MATFGKRSLEWLATCHPDIQKVLNLAITKTDFSVLYGTRTEAEQFELYKVGRALINGHWQVVGKVVTNLDGKIKKSKHNSSPSQAVDVAPYPIDWNDIGRFKHLASIIKECAHELNVDIVWGGDWKKFVDYPHFELKGK